MRKIIRFVTLFFVAASCLSAIRAAAADPAPVAIKGYDPVAYFTAGKPTKGSPDIALEWDEHRYQFATEENRARFKADPVRYAPQFSDYCAMALGKGSLVEADPESWTIADGKLYLFGKPIGVELFHKDVAANKAKAEANRKLLPMGKS